MRLKNLIDFLQQVAPSELQEPYDNAGLITGHPDMEISGVLVCLDAIEAVVDEAISLGCNVIVAHHPILFRPLKRLNGYDYVERTLLKAIRHDIAMFAIHTNLDNVYLSGVNGKIAEKMGLENTRILAPKQNQWHDGHPVGAGLIGTMPEPMDVSVFFGLLKEKMELNVIRHTTLCKAKIHRVAVCGGAGSFLLPMAMREGADIFVTADYKYHEFFDADNQIIIADIGHYESEKYTIELLYSLIMNNFSTFAAHCTKIVTNPVKYV
jgi:dinuclear metal center YbgI/SA1388 family protein